MTVAGIFDSLPLALLFVLTFGLTLLELELGFRLGRRERSHDIARESIGPMVGALLGLLAFMLAFTFGMAANRFDARKQLVLEEASAIGTAHLRASFLTTEHAERVRALLEEYVARRTSVSPTDLDELRVAIIRSEEIHSLLWQEILTSRNEGGSQHGWSLAAQSINDVIDLHQNRITVGLKYRIPDPIWIVLYVLSALAMVATGYHVGLGGPRRPSVVVFNALAFSSALLLIGDLDRVGGFMQVGQQPMIDLHRSFQQDPPSAPRD